MTTIKTVVLPDIGEGVVEGEVVQWLKEEGDELAQDEPVVSVMTDKATVELPAPVPGTLHKKYISEGEMAKVDSPLYDIETDQEEQTSEKVEDESKQASPLFQKQEKPIQPKDDSSVLATPRTRDLAKKLGVDLSKIPATGKEGRVSESDVVSFHAKSSASGSVSKTGQRAAPSITKSTPILYEEDDTETPLSGMQNLMAEKMVEAKMIAPHFSFFDRLDATQLIAAREKIKPKAESEGIKLTFMPFFIRALSFALKKFPSANSSVDLGQHSIVTHAHHHIGIATHLEEGLVVAVLRNVDQMNFEETARAYDSLMKKMKEGKLERQDLVGSTITISNFGPLGGLFATPILNYPEVAILGLARIKDEPLVKKGKVIVRPQMNLSWTCDHRVLDGHGIAHLSNEFIRLLEHPAEIL